MFSFKAISLILPRGKPTENVKEHSLFAGRDSNQAPQEYRLECWKHYHLSQLSDADVHIFKSTSVNLRKITQMLKHYATTWKVAGSIPD
jgi:hypothetical protein